MEPSLPDIVGSLPSPIIGADSDLGRLFLADPRHDGAALLSHGRAAAIALGAVLFAWAWRWHGRGAVTLALVVAT
ncbi:MAG: hypothetical protein Q8N18_12935 [Opitutaceae bacterium]|nr:hypothetical protein [Opitutaceae bacterium]